MKYFTSERLESLMNKARLGWWEADFVTQRYTCSEYLCQLLNLGDSNTISFADFRQLICQDYHLRTVQEFTFGKTQNSYDQVYPLEINKKIIWVRVKLCSKETDSQGNLKTYGFMECLDTPETVTSEIRAIQRVNDLFAQQNSISRSLFSLFRTEDMSSVINKILSEILQQYPQGRIYIMEHHPADQTNICRYEACNDLLSTMTSSPVNVAVKADPWLTRQLIDNAEPLILANPDELPPAAGEMKHHLAASGIKSMLVVPMFSRNGVWGFAGIEIRDHYHVWKNEDYQWFSSLLNIISICTEFRQSEEKMRVEKQYLADLYKHMPLGFARFKILYDARNRISDFYLLDANEACLSIYQISREIIGKKASELNLNTRNYFPLFEQVLSSNTPQSINYHLDKQQKYCHAVLYSPQKDEIISLFADMTDTFAAHQALDHKERILHNIYRNLPAGIELYDKDGFLVDINDKELELFGLQSKEQVLGINVFDNPIMPESMKEKLRKKENANFSIDYDFSKLSDYYISSSTTPINLLTKVTSLYDSQNNFTNYLLINIDRTEATIAYNQIREFKDFFTLVGDYAKVGYAHFDALTRDGYALSSWYKNVGEQDGTPLTEIIGIHSHFYPEDREAMIHFLQKVIRGESTNLRRDVRIFRPDGRLTWTRVNVLVRAYRPQEGIIEMVCINYDITELKDIETKLTEAKEKAEESDRLKSAFLANMSHEIRTPLNAIVGFSTLLAETADPDEQKQYLEIVEKNNELLLQLISDILDLSKIEAGIFEMSYQEFNVNELCENIISSLKGKNPSGVELKFADHLPECYISSDKKRIQQVLINFINNAQKFTTEGAITLGYETRCGEIKFYVRDTGIGISEEKQPQIFQRFVKLNAFIPGTGLGLSICQSIIHQLKGQIGLTSQPGQGSCFWFTLPLTQ